MVVSCRLSVVGYWGPVVGAEACGADEELKQFVKSNRLTTAGAGPDLPLRITFPLVIPPFRVVNGRWEEGREATGRPIPTRSSVGILGSGSDWSKKEREVRQSPILL